MRKLLGIVLAVPALIGALVVLGAPPAGACSCVGDPLSFADEYDAVFVGRADGRGEPVDIAGGPRSRQVVIEVTDVYKGDVSARQTVVVPTDEASCGVDLNRPEAVVILGSDASILGHKLADGVYGTGLCSTVWLADPAAAPELRALGEPHPPNEGRSASLPGGSRYLPVEPLEWWFLGVGTVLALALIGGAAWLVGRRPRHPTTT